MQPPDNSFGPRACPICGSSSAAPLFRQSFEQLSKASLMSGYDVVVCKSCGAGFASGIPSQETFDEYYRGLSKYEHVHRDGKESTFDEQRFRDVAQTIRPLIQSAGARILEIGCSTGRQLALLKETGFPKVEGVDPSPGCAAAAMRLYEIPVFAATIFTAPETAEGYDFVIVSHVLEHIEDLGRALESIRSILTPSGRVYAETPDASRLAGRSDAPYQEFSTEHINFFAPLSLSNVFGLHGFRLVEGGRVVRLATEHTTVPSVWGVFEKIAGGPAAPVFDSETGPSLRTYIEECGGEDARIRAAIRNGAAGRPIIVWGVGTHTQRLLATGAFDDIRIEAFVDSNPKYQSQELHGAKVIAPAAVGGIECPILISSHGFQNEIRDDIRSKLGLSNELILLY